MLDNTLIEKALALTGKTMEDMIEILYNPGYDKYHGANFSIEKFCYYLLSPEFIERYGPNYDDFFSVKEHYTYFGEAIYEYQIGNEEPLENLLSKIIILGQTNISRSQM